jgi:hypothetical protein
MGLEARERLASFRRQGAEDHEPITQLAYQLALILATIWAKIGPSIARWRSFYRREGEVAEIRGRRGIHPQISQMTQIFKVEDQSWVFSCLSVIPVA